MSTTIRSTNQVPIIVERTMWWPGPEAGAGFWREASNARGATAPASRWALAGSALGGSTASDTFVLIANPNPTEVHAVVEATGAHAQFLVTLPPTSRTTVPLAVAFPELVGTRFGVIVHSTDLSRPPLVVEQATYESPAGVLWSAGTAVLATPVP